MLEFGEAWEWILNPIRIKPTSVQAIAKLALSDLAVWPQVSTEEGRQSSSRKVTRSGGGLW
jgi:hypothetical protein